VTEKFIKSFYRLLKLKTNDYFYFITDQTSYFEPLIIFVYLKDLTVTKFIDWT